MNRQPSMDHKAQHGTPGGPRGRAARAANPSLPPPARPTPAEAADGRGEPWTEERVEMLRWLWDRGWSGAAIARALETSRSAVLGKARRLGLASRRRQRPGSRVAAARRIPFAPPEDRCQYPQGLVGAPGFRFCGAAVQPGSPYCPAHHARCYVQGEEDAEVAA